ncbi:MAG: Ig-like domain-containing protein [Chloroflexota bacterium]
MFQRWPILVLTLVFALTLASASPGVLAQEPALSPQVIDIWPLPGVQLSPDEPLTITFDQAMNADSVENALRFTPQVEGAFDWPDERTLRFTPEAGWPRAAEIEVILGSEATSASGVALDAPVTFVLETVGPLAVADVVPGPDSAGIAVDSRIIVTFDRPVVPLGSGAQAAALPLPLEFEPAIEGTGEWVNTSIYVFTPDQPLQGGQRYTVAIPPGLTAADGAVMEDSYIWSFETLPPQIVEVTPGIGQTGVPLDSTIAITFSEPMDRASVEAAFALLEGSVAVPGTIGWSDDSTSLTFTPDAALKMETTYTIRVDGAARAAEGQAALGDSFFQSFETIPYPRVSETQPQNGAVDVDTRWSRPQIVFNTPVNFESLENRIRIDPAPESWYPDINFWDPRRLTLHFDMAQLTTYTITIDAGVEDIYGNAMPEAFSFSFTSGPLQPEAYPIINGSFMITSAYREDTRFAMMTTGRGEFYVSLYEVTPEAITEAAPGKFQDYFFSAASSTTFSEELPPWVTEANLLRAWMQTFDTGDRQRVPQEVLLASEAGGRLPVGLYWVVVTPSAPSHYYMSNFYQFGLAVANANVAVKRGPEDLLVWVTDLQSAKPVSGATVTIYHNGSVIGTGETAADGTMRLPVALPPDDDVIYVTVSGDDVYGAWYSNRAIELPDERAYLYTDRPIYRPGETVRFRGVVRDRHDMDFAIPDVQTVHVTIKPPYEDRIYAEMDLEVTDFGTFSGEYVIPADAPVGDQAIVVDFGDGVSYEYGYLGPVWNLDKQTRVLFTVAEFRPPEYTLSVTAETESILQGEPLTAIAEATYYAGGGVGNAQLTYTAYGTSTFFNYEGQEYFSFNDETAERVFWQELVRGEAQTDSNGRLIISTSETSVSTPLPLEILVDATLTDESGQPVSASTRIIAHPASVYVGLRTEDYFHQPGEPIDVTLLTVTPDSVPVAGEEVELEVSELVWKRISFPSQPGQYRWQQESTVVATDRVITGADGRATYRYSPPRAGTFRIRAVVRDAQERQASATMRLYVTGGESIIWSEPSEYLNLQANQTSYLPGDTAEILIPLPSDDVWTLLITTERATVMKHEVVEVTGTSLLYELPLDNADAPTVHVGVVALRGASETDVNPDFATGSISLNVEPVEQRLTIEVEPSTSLAQPRETVTFDLTATDANGEPARAEIGVALVDRSVLDLLPPNSTTLEETFYGTQNNYVLTEVAMSGLLDLLTDAAFPNGLGGGGGGYAEPAFIREDFEYTPLWAPHIVTDENGRATVTVDLPDNLTTWRLDARAVTMDTEVGQTTTEIISTLPLRVRPVAPRFFVAGDRVQLGAVINNNTGSPQTVEATLDATGVTLESPASQTVTIDAGSRARVDWTVVVQDAPGVDLVFSATSEQGYQDAARPALRTGPDDTIPVYAYSAPETIGTGGMLREGGAATETIALPPRLAGAGGELRINLDSSLAATTLEALDYLKNYDHQSTEETISRLLPNAATYRALAKLGVDDPALEADLSGAITEAISLLVEEQKANGGWSWFSGMETADPLVTAYGALGLIEARDAGFDVPAEAIQQALQFVNGSMEQPQEGTPAYQLNRQAFYLYVMARDHQLDAGVFQRHFDQRLRMSLAARAYLLLAAGHGLEASTPAIPALVSDLSNAARLSSTGAHWEEQVKDWYNWGSDTRTTALALQALALVDPDNSLLPNAVRWLMVARQGDHWQTAQETAWAVTALARWMQISGELEGSYDYEARLNGAMLAQAQVAPENAREGDSLRVSVAHLLADTANRLTVARSDGEGALYYSAFLDLQLPASEVEALSRGISVDRQYFLNGDPKQPVSEAQVGDIITVRLTLVLPEEMYYVALEDPLPAGVESLDTRLLTTTAAAQAPTLRMPLQSDPFWFHGWWWFDRTELRDESTNLFADFLPRGTYVYTYQVRATVPGEFNVMPAHAYAVYQPDVFGRTAGGTFTVLPGPEQLNEE